MTQSYTPICKRMMIAAYAFALFASPALAREPTPVRDVEAPARSAFMAFTDITMPAGFQSVNGVALFDVPVGRRAVIEQMSARCDVAPGNPVLEVFVEVALVVHEGNASRLRFQIPVRSQGTRVPPGFVEKEFFIGALATQVYADRGATGVGVTGGAARASANFSGDCEIQISGHTVAL